jgi:hypothetical protein
MSYLQAIADAISDKFLDEPVVSSTTRHVEQWLNVEYPEAKWHVEIKDIDGGWSMVLDPDFDSPELETYFKLKYL